jgi:hypothetical protein
MSTFLLTTVITAVMSHLMIQIFIGTRTSVICCILVGIFVTEHRFRSSFLEGRKPERRYRTFFPGISVSNAPPPPTKFSVLEFF